MPAFPTLEDLNQFPADRFSRALAPLFEGAPRFLTELADARPFSTTAALFDAARAMTRELPLHEQIELLDAHPRIGADPAVISALSHVEQGFDHPATASDGDVADRLQQLNDAYEARFGFRFVIFVAGRARGEIAPILERALGATRENELRRGIHDLVLIAEDRMRRQANTRA